jgi:hypothetical protein
MPTGALALGSATPFNVIRVQLLSAPSGATEFMLDNVSVRVTASVGHAIATTASPSAGGTTSGDGVYADGASVTVTATANAGYALINWTEGGVPVSTSASYTFTAGANRTLVANFAPLLRVTLNAVTNVVLTWPASAPGVGLEQSPDLGPASWVNTTNPVEVVGDRKQVTISPPTGSWFYRLGPI